MIKSYENIIYDYGRRETVYGRSSSSNMKMLILHIYCNALHKVNYKIILFVKRKMSFAISVIFSSEVNKC